MTMDWDLLRLFLAVARAGSLSAAARRLEVSQPTLSRRMAELEAVLGATLFIRTRDGYRPTEIGDRLLEQAETVERTVNMVRGGALGGQGPLCGTVQVAAGEWASRFLARNLHRIVGDHPGIRIELLTSLAYVSLSRQEADIAVRNRLPDAKELIQQKVGATAYAVYGHRDYVAADGIDSANCFERGRWVSFDESHEHLRSARWVQERIGNRPLSVRCDSSRAILDALQGRAGLALLPCFVGDGEADMVRVTDVAYRSDLFLVAHPDSRGLPHVDAVWRGLVALYRAERGELGCDTLVAAEPA
ncbi:MAG TPA: LysR family transcriptional regulator [Azospirillaceae bacterium]|nr:LysR family transcriptional regulator [Azospirillaceae bacterium]